MAKQTKILQYQPGINRDGTNFSSQQYIDGQWVRFYDQGRPRKIGGYSTIIQGKANIIRNLYAVPLSNSFAPITPSATRVAIYMGRYNTFSYTTVGGPGAGTSEIDRTPGSGVNVISLPTGSVATIASSNILTFAYTGTVFNVGDTINISGINAGNGLTTNAVNISSATIENITTAGFTVLTPVVALVNPNPIRSAVGTQVITITAPGSNIATGAKVFLRNFESVGGIPATEINVLHTVTTGGTDSFTVTVGTTNANATVDGGGTRGSYQQYANATGALSGVITLTTAHPFIAYENNTWSIDSMGLDASEAYDPAYTAIIAIAIPNGQDIASTSNQPIWYGDISQTSALTRVPNAPLVSGGICVVDPFLFAYGNNGVVQWSEAGNIFSWPDANIAVIGGTKIVQAYAMRGSTTPTALFWALDQLIVGSFDPSLNEGVGGFSFNPLQKGTTILSPNSVIRVDNTFYWIGARKFYTYSGVVQELPNETNKQFFFRNLSTTHTQNVCGFYNEAFNELWWLWPDFHHNENNRYLSYNLTTGAWSDGFLDRSAAIGQSVFPYPVMADTQQYINPHYRPLDLNEPFMTYPLWVHEVGVDKQLYNTTLPITSYFQTPEESMIKMDPGAEFTWRTRRLIPDFELQGNMQFSMITKSFPQSTPQESEVYTFDSTTEKIDLDNNASIVSYKFSSNEVGGFYQQGQTMVEIKPGDKRPGSGSPQAGS